MLLACWMFSFLAHNLNEIAKKRSANTWIDWVLFGFLTAFFNPFCIENIVTQSVDSKLCFSFACSKQKWEEQRMKAKLVINCSPGFSHFHVTCMVNIHRVRIFSHAHRTHIHHKERLRLLDLSARKSTKKIKEQRYKETTHCSSLAAWECVVKCDVLCFHHISVKSSI